MSAPSHHRISRTSALQKTPPDLRPEQLEIPASLPVAKHADALISSIRDNPVTIVCGATGSGKSTQLPKLALRAGRLSVAHTQPRRLAARTLAERIAGEMGCEIGAEVGWQVRFAQAASERSCIKLMTDGILLSELRHDRSLSRYDTVIIDEAHERSLNIDFLLGCLHRLLQKRPDLRLIITSATLDAEKFSKHFHDAPVFSVEGRSFPVEMRYRPPPSGDLAQGIAEGIRELWKSGPGDILVFLPGEREIRDLRDSLPRRVELSRYSDAEYLPLYARLPASQQQRIFAPKREGRRVILATNVAETSLTVPGIRYVIDTGLARIARFSPRTQLQSLAIENIAQDASAQRAGRCGRLAPGICIRLYDEDEFITRPEETAPEILRSNLADVVLQMADRRLGQAEDFPFVDKPETRLLRDARRLLQQLQALRPDGSTTPTGRRMARLPVEPRFARMLVEAERVRCLDDTVIIVAALSMPDVREIGPEDRDAARQCHAPWRDAQSDFTTLLNIHRALEDAREELSRGAFERWCRSHFLSPRRVREWNDLIHQIHRELRSAEFRRENSQPENLHRAVLAGLLDHIGHHHENGEFRGPRGILWRVHPESALKKSRSGWLFAASIVSTQRTFARTVAHIEPNLILTTAGPLVRKTPLEPRWDKKRGEAVCTEQCQLFGLIIDNQRQAPLSKYDASLAREIFIREALVNGNWGDNAPPSFLQHNSRLCREITAEEERLRRRDLLIDEDSRSALYAAHIPVELCSRNGLLHWLATNADKALRWTREQLTASTTNTLVDAWPTAIVIRGQELRLKYRFAPGDPDDGVTVLLPLEALSQLRAEDFDGCVPGLVEQQLDAWLRNLPKADRKKLIPLNQSIAELQSAVEIGSQFRAQLRSKLEQRLGHAISADLMALNQLPDKLRLRFCIMPQQPRTTPDVVQSNKRRRRSSPGRKPLACSRDIDALRRELAAPAIQAAEAAVDIPQDRREPLTRFPDKPPQWEQRSPQGTPLRLIFRDHGDSVVLEVCANPNQAEHLHTTGIRRLAWLHLKSRINLRLKGIKKLNALRRLANEPEAAWSELLRFMAGNTGGGSLAEAIGLNAIGDVQQLALADRESFESSVDREWPAIDRRLQAAMAALERLEPQWQKLCLGLVAEPESSPLLHATTLLMHPSFACTVDDWNAMPRYLEALLTRLEKRQRNPGLDHDREQQVHAFETRLLEYMAKRPLAEKSPLVRQIFWALQDFRVSLFAQELGVPHPVSPKRINQLFLQLTATA